MALRTGVYSVHPTTFANAARRTNAAPRRRRPWRLNEWSLIVSQLYLSKIFEPGQERPGSNLKERIRLLELTEARRARTIGRGVHRIVLVAVPIHAGVGGGNVGVGIRFRSVVIEPRRNRLTRRGWRQVGCASALVVVPRLFSHLEIRDVLLGEDLIEKRLPGDDFRRESIVPVV